MTDNELNKLLHEKVMGDVWYIDFPFYNYCHDLNAVRKAEEKVIERLAVIHKNPKEIYCRYVMLANGFSFDGLGYLYEQVIRATARQRAEACWKAWSESELGDEED